jgi:hypothetical protein
MAPVCVTHLCDILCEPRESHGAKGATLCEKPQHCKQDTSSVGVFLLTALYLIYLVITFTYHLFLHLLSTNHKCTQPCYFPLLLKPAAQKEMVDWNSLMRSSRLRVTPVAIPVVLWSLPLFRFVESHLSL